MIPQSAGLAAEGASILIVDDTPANLVALEAVLEPLGVRIVKATTGREAIEHVVREPFAVVLLDVQMPELDGFEVARRIRETAAGAEAPIIFLTAIHDDEAYARKGYASGGADYVTKPFDPEVLRARVRAFVDLFHQRERLRLEQVGARTRERDEALERLAALLERERAARCEAEIANRAKDEFLATVSHELRTPLGAILGWTTIARRHSQSPEAVRALAIVERNARMQMAIVEDLLDLGRIVRGGMRLEISATKVADAVDGAALSARPAADAKQVSLRVAVDPGVGVISADAARLQQIVTNLLSNAIKFTPAGGHVDLTARRVESKIVIEVRDDGEGIHAEFLPRLFEPFRQGDGSATRRHAGVGLGLAIVKQLVEAHGGEIRVHSDGEGKGALFTVTLPASAMLQPPTDASEAPQDGESTASTNDNRLDGVRLLVVDDDEDSRDFIACILAEQGAVVVVASCAGEALDLLETTRPDVLLSDIGMPRVDGYALLRRVREMPPARGGETPAVALTAYARAVDGERALAAGFQAHLVKPVDQDRLLQIVADLAGRGTHRSQTLLRTAASRCGARAHR
jgi:signal transduction histidine kinase